jgi:hypothetical protein
VSRILLFVLAAGCLGCGGGNPPLTGASVQGVVRYKGKPVTGGTIFLFAKEEDSRNPVAEGQIDGNGTYQVKNAPLGPVKVVVDTSTARFDPRAMIEMAKAKGARIDDSKLNSPQGPSLKYVEIDPKYGDPNKTTVEITVAQGENTQDIDLP